MKILFITLTLLMLGSRDLLAQGAPDIVWKTNAPLEIVLAVNFSPQSDLLVSAVDDVGKLWRVSDATLLRTFSLPQETVAVAVFSPDGSRIVGGGDGGIRIWQTSDGTILFIGSGGGNGVQNIAWSPNGAVFALARENPTISIRNGTNGAGVGSSLEGHEGVVRTVAFSLDSSLLASGSDDQTVKLWHWSSRTLLTNFVDHIGPVTFSPDGQHLAMTRVDGRTDFYNLTNGLVEKTLEGGGNAIDFSPDGRILGMVSGGLLKFWRVTDRRLLQTYDQEIDGGATCIDIAPNGKLFGYGRNDGTIVVARMPLIIDSITRSGNETILHWQGGSGLYQLQARTNFTSDSWQNVGGTTTNTIATNVNSATTFFRVQSLPNP